MTMRKVVLAAGLLLCLAQEALADKTFILRMDGAIAACTSSI